MNLGIAILALGLMGKATVRMYKTIRSKDYMTLEKVCKIYGGGFQKTMDQR